MKKLVKIIALLAILLLIPSVCYAVEADSSTLSESRKAIDLNNDKKAVSSEQYLLFSDLVYNNLDAHIGESVDSFIENKDVIKKQAKRTYKNKTGEISTQKIMKKHLAGYYVDKIFQNEKSGLYGVAFKNPEQKQIVLAFRGTADLYGGINDVEFGILAINSSQMIEALDVTSDYIKENTKDFTISTTGHSLGGGIALEISHFYYFYSETFNSAQMTKALYFNNRQIYSAVYEGFDRWRHLDHVNEEDFVVGTFEYAISKKAQKHENASKSNRFFAHSVNHLVDINGDDFAVTAPIATDYLEDLDAIAYNLGSDGLILGSSGDNFIKSQRVFNSNDIIYAGDGDDIVEAGGGNDYIVGGKGIDSLDGGAGDDEYAYYEGHGNDIIVDPIGNDRLTIYSKGKLTFEDTDTYYIVKQNDEEIVRIDKIVRADGFARDSDFSFTIYDASNKKSHKIALDGKTHKLKKVKVLYAGDVDICDLKGNVLATIKNETSHINLPSLSAYCDYDDYWGSWAKYIYVADPIYNIVPHRDNENILVTIDEGDRSGDIAKYSAGDIKIKDTITIELNRKVPQYILNGRANYFTKTKYTNEPPINVKSNVIFTCEKFTGKIETILSTEEKDNASYVEYWSSDEDVLKVNPNGTYTAKKAGSAMVLIELDGYKTLVRVYVFDFQYTAGFLCIIAFILALILMRLHKRVRSRRYRQAIEA